jgi:hypothetical protein
MNINMTAAWQNSIDQDQAGGRNFMQGLNTRPLPEVIPPAEKPSFVSRQSLILKSIRPAMIISAYKRI